MFFDKICLVINLKIIRKKYKCYLEENTLLFDIETSGLFSKKDYIYIVGLVYKNKIVQNLFNFFLEEKNEEKELLKESLKLFKNKKIVGFNSEAFDIRFIKDG